MTLEEFIKQQIDKLNDSLPDYRTVQFPKNALGGENKKEKSST